jgi:competence protein ComEC
VFRYSFGALSILFFAIMTGGSATVVRASIMASLVILAEVTKREYLILRVLILTGFLMVLHNPKILVFDPSFQLSFMATLGLITLSPIISKYLSFITEKWGLREIVSATLSTQIFVFPMILYMMGTLSIVAPLVNLLVLPIIPIAMFTGFFTGVFGFIFYPISIFFGFISEFLLAYVLKTVEIFSNLPFASVTIKDFPFLLVIVWYGVCAVWIWRFRKQPD